MWYESHKYYNGNLYASIAKDVKNQQLFMDLHSGIAMDVKYQPLLWNLHAGITMDDKKNQTLFMRLICEYCNEW
jgi:hypothetical protein